MHKRKLLTISLILIMALTLAGLSFNVSARPLAATSPTLGAADPFVVLAGTGITNVPISAITGDVGLSPAAGSNITAGVTAAQVTGTIYAVDATGPAGSVANPGLLTNAKNDLIIAYDRLAATDNAPCTVDYGVGPQNLTLVSPLVPGVYCVGAGGFTLTGNLTLTGSSGVWIFRSAATIITSPASSVTGGDPCNVWWRAETSATLDTTTSFLGNILALTSITLNNGATLNGRALARNGAVTMNHNTIAFPICAAQLTQTVVATTLTAVPTNTATRTPTSIPTNTATRTPTSIPTNTATRTPTSIPTSTPRPAVLPGTGFSPNGVTVLSNQSADKAYTAMGDLWLEVPKLGVQMNIVGVPETAGTWDVSWLGKQAGWLQGSAFPTWTGNSVLTGHVWNADNTVGPFRYINTLWWGDKVIVHAWGAKYVYEVRSVTQVGPGNTAAMMKHETLPWITLVTCRGYDQASNSYKYRVLVRAVLIEVK